MNADLFRQATGCTIANAAKWAAPISQAMAEFWVATPERQTAFLAQIGHESGGFVYTHEIWGPTAAQSGYEGRADLGNTQPGDGFRYRGRGPIMVTGRANYRSMGHALGVDLEASPELLEKFDLGARSAGQFWASRGCNHLADAGDFIALTRRINGGLNGLADRQLRWKLAKEALGVS